MFKLFLDEAFQGPLYLLDWLFIADLSVLLLCIMFYSSYEIWDRHGKIINTVFTIFVTPIVFFAVVGVLSLFNIKEFPRNLSVQFICSIAFLILLVLERKIGKKHASTRDKRWYDNHVTPYDNDIAYYESIIGSGGSGDHAELRECVERLKRERSKVLSERPHH